MTEKKSIKSDDMSRLAVYRKMLMEKPRLMYLFVELTDACNMSCLHCGSNCGQGNGTFIDRERLIRSLRELVEDVSPENVMICLTGGEPLLHPFFEVAEEIKRLRFPLGMTSNCTLVL